MAAYTPERAREVLPSGGTRLHRAILKKDGEAVRAWMAAGADPFVLSAPLPATVSHRWSEMNGRVDANRTRGLELSAAALALYTCASEAEVPWVEAVIENIPLNTTPGASLFRAFINNPAHARLPALWRMLLDHGLELPKAYEPQTASSLPATYAGDFFTRLSTQEEQTWVALRGWPHIHRQFKLGDSPLDKLLQSEHGDRSEAIVRWLASGMPLDNPREALVNWPRWYAAQDPVRRATWEAGLNHLMARGATLDSVAGEPGHEWDAPTLALRLTRLDLARDLMARQGLTLKDATGTGYTPAANLLRQSLNHGQYTYFDHLDRQVGHGLPLDETQGAAKGVRSLLTELPIAGLRSDAYPWAAQTAAWRTWAINHRIPDAGIEADRPISAFDCWWAQALKVHSTSAFNNPNKLNHGTILWQELKAWCAYAERPLAEHAQTLFQDLMATKVNARIRTEVGGNLIALGATPFPPQPGQSPTDPTLWDREGKNVQEGWLTIQWAGRHPPFDAPALARTAPRQKFEEVWWQEMIRDTPIALWHTPVVFRPDTPTSPIALALECAPIPTLFTAMKQRLAQPQQEPVPLEPLLSLLETLQAQNHAMAALPEWPAFLTQVQQQAIQAKGLTRESPAVTPRRPGLRRS
jgi:hypothetical protein